MSALYVHETTKTGPESGEIHHFPGLDSNRYVYYDQEEFPEKSNALHNAERLAERYKAEHEKNPAMSLRDFAFYITEQAVDKVNNSSGYGFVCLKYRPDKVRFYMEKL